MSKKHEEKFLDRLIKLHSEEEKAVTNQVAQFYENKERVDFYDSSPKDPFAGIFSALKKEPALYAMTQEQMLKECEIIRENIKRGETDNTELNFVKGVQRFNGTEYPLDYTVIKVTAMNAEQPIYFYIKKGDTLHSLVFIGGSNVQAFLLAKDDTGADCAVRLYEFHALSISDNSDENKEIGLITSYSWINARVYASVIMGASLNPVKNLFLFSDGFKNKYEQVPKRSATATEDKDYEQNQ